MAAELNEQELVRELDDALAATTTVSPVLVTVLAPSWKVAARYVQWGRRNGWHLHFAAAATDTKDDYPVTFIRYPDQPADPLPDVVITREKKTDWKMKVGYVDNEYQVFVNDFNVPVKKSQRHDNEEAVKPGDREVDLTPHLALGENKVRVTLIDYGGASQLTYALERNGREVHTVDRRAAGYDDLVLRA